MLPKAVTTLCLLLFFLAKSRASVVVAGETFACTAKYCRIGRGRREARLFSDAIGARSRVLEDIKLGLDFSFRAIRFLVSSRFIKASLTGRFIIIGHHLRFGVFIWERQLEE